MWKSSRPETQCNRNSNNNSNSNGNSVCGGRWRGGKGWRGGGSTYEQFGAVARAQEHPLAIFSYKIPTITQAASNPPQKNLLLVLAHWPFWTQELSNFLPLFPKPAQSGAPGNPTKWHEHARASPVGRKPVPSSLSRIVQPIQNRTKSCGVRSRGLH
eukprot:352587-Chlamydomonas_euryale.AAC.2